MRADMADGTHAIVEARREAWRLEESLWAEARAERDARPAPSRCVREQKERVRELVDRRKQLGFPVPEGCEAWWTRVRGPHGRAARRACPSDRAAGRLSRSAPAPASDRRAPQPAPPAEQHDEEDHGDDLEPDRRARRSSTPATPPRTR